jgi:hypothetical protein
VPHQSDPAYLESLHRELALAIGNAVWAFARIEWAITIALGRAGGSLDHLLAEFSFRQRTTILRKLLPDLGIYPETQAELAGCITQFERLSEKRNLIAHNPWMIWLDQDAKEIMTEIQHYSRQEKRLDLSALQEFTNECNEALKRFDTVAVSGRADR